MGMEMPVSCVADGVAAAVWAWVWVGTKAAKTQRRRGRMRAVRLVIVGVTPWGMLRNVGCLGNR